MLTRRELFKALGGAVIGIVAAPAVVKAARPLDMALISFTEPFGVDFEYDADGTEHRTDWYRR